MKKETMCGWCDLDYLDIDLHNKNTHTTALQHCGTCNKFDSTWANPTPTRLGFCSWCWSAIKVNA
jgi:hypothetical protein